MYSFLSDLDEYFCEKYANYDKLCILSGYKMPVMQATRLDEFGRTYAYTLPAETMRLAKQEKKAELLAELKTRLADKTFSFSFQPIGLFRRIKNRFSKFAMYKNLRAMLAKYGETPTQAGELLDVSPEIWSGICKGKYLPTKNLLYSLALTSQFSLEDLSALLALNGEEFDFATPKDVVMYYLLNHKIYDEGMIAAACAEYKIENLFIKNA